MNNKEIAARLRGLTVPSLDSMAKRIVALADEIYPPTKVIDLSVLIESGIDCEFSDNKNDWFVGLLVNFSDIDYRDPIARWKYCRPRMNHVHAWMGGKCPLPDGLLIKLHFRFHAPREETVYNELRWGCNDMASDIIAFEVLGKAENYMFPWESK